MKKREKIKATWLSLMSIVGQSVFTTKTIELLDGNYDSIASISCVPNDDDGIGAINFSDWLLNHFDKATNDCELEMLLKGNNVTARVNMSGDEHEINLSDWLLAHIDTATDKRELADVFAKTRYILAKDIDDDTLWWRHRVSGLYCGARYIEAVKTEEPGKFIATYKRRISRF